MISLDLDLALVEKLVLVPKSLRAMPSGVSSWWSPWGMIQQSAQRCKWWRMTAATTELKADKGCNRGRPPNYLGFHFTRFWSPSAKDCVMTAGTWASPLLQMSCAGLFQGDQTFRHSRWKPCSGQKVVKGVRLWSLAVPRQHLACRWWVYGSVAQPLD